MVNNQNIINIYSIDYHHYNGINYINNIKIPLTFSEYMLNYINTLNKEKDLDYNFIETITNERKWIRKYTNNSIINNSTYGRDINKKYELDKKYS